MPQIRLLPDNLVSQIAAGEVVERPASVVKELVENALDAGASEVQVELVAGGKRRIAVTDDGAGMDSSDALLAFDRHATSKIASFEDLERVATLGFRGEALASIAAVARVELITATAAGEGHRVRIEGGRVKVAEPAARARGTSVEVASLFFNVPARRKFLKTPQTELRRSLEVLQGYALARPEVRFTVLHEGRALLDALPAAEEGFAGARRRIGQLFGSGLAENLVEIPAIATAGESVGGFVGNRETTRGRRLFVFVNRRLLRDRAVLATFYRAVREEWKADNFPALFLFLDLPPDEVDVNVHPQKAEVRFRNPGLLGRVSEALRGALAEARGEEPAPLREPSGRPSQPFAWQGLGERRRQEHPYPGGAVDGGWEVREPPAAGGSEGGASPWTGRDGASAPPPWSGGAEGGGPPGPPSGGPPGKPAAFPPGQGRLAAAAYAPVERATIPLSGRSGEPRPFRLLGQYKGTLILLEGHDGLYLVDQHVAHERILFERLRRALEGERPESQTLLTPVLLEVSTAERERLLELEGELSDMGFGVGDLSGGTVGLTAVPAVLSAEEGEELVLALAQEEGLGGGGEPAVVRRKLLEALAAGLACRNAVKMHHPLAPREMESLLSELFAAEQPYACPHGRPIVLKMSDADLERRFGRR